jgi:hypothetical protein
MRKNLGKTVITHPNLNHLKLNKSELMLSTFYRCSTILDNSETCSNTSTQVLDLGLNT